MGDILRFTKPVNGTRCYLSCAGVWAGEAMLGSIATNMRESMGGLTGGGKPLSSGDKLQANSSAVRVRKQIPKWLVPDFNQQLEFGVIPGFQFDQFAFAQREKLFACEYFLSKDCDRMGYRLQGEPITPRSGGLISEPVVSGAIQVPADGQPIILMADRQTLGGYSTLGAVFSLDRARLSQKIPGQSVKFRKMSLYEARNRRRVFESRLV